MSLFLFGYRCLKDKLNYPFLTKSPKKALLLYIDPITNHFLREKKIDTILGFQ